MTHKSWMTPQEYIDADFPGDYVKSNPKELVITRDLTPAQAAAALVFMTGTNGLCLTSVARPVDAGHIFYAAVREAKKGKTLQPQPAPCEGKTVEIDGVTYKLVAA